jgi:FMN reductase
MTEPIRITAVVGNPKAGSRTLGAATALADALTGIWETPVDRQLVTVDTVDLATISDGILAPWRLSPDGSAAVAAARSADILLLATPTYKASYTGLLKLFLDNFAAGSLSETVVIPLIVSGGPAHRHLADIQLRPVLAELGAVSPLPSLLVEESELPQLDDLVAGYVGRHGTLLAATVGALAASRAAPAPAAAAT